MMRKYLLLMLLVPLFAVAEEKRPGALGFVFSCNRATDAKPCSAGWLTVREVEPGRPADRAGLQPGDLIVALNGRKIEFTDDLDVFVLIGETVKPDEKLALTIVRNGKRQSIEMIPARMADDAWERWKATVAMLRAQRARAAQKRE